jgi:hypothetical protein
VKNANEWAEEIGFKSDDVVRRAVAALLKRGLIIKEVHRSPFHKSQSVCYIRPNWPVFGALLKSLHGENASRQTAKTPVGKRRKRQSANGENASRQTAKTPAYLTESNTETISDVTQTSPSSPPTPPDDDSDFFQQWEKRLGRAKQPIQEKLKAQLDRLGRDKVIEIIRRCLEKGGKTWAYVLKALENETAEVGKRDYTGGIPGAEGEETYEQQRAWARGHDEQRRARCKSAQQSIRVTENAAIVQSIWDAACEQLKKLLGLPKFRKLLDNAVLVDFEPKTGTFLVVVRYFHSAGEASLNYNVIFQIVRDLYGKKPYNLQMLDHAGWRRLSASQQQSQAIL